MIDCCLTSHTHLFCLYGDWKHQRRQKKAYGALSHALQLYSVICFDTGRLQLASKLC